MHLDSGRGLVQRCTHRSRSVPTARFPFNFVLIDRSQVQQLQQQKKRHKGKAFEDEEEDEFHEAEEESEEKDQKPAGAAHPAAGAHAWNHIAGGGLHSGAAAANGLGADTFTSAAGAATGNSSELASAAGKRKNIAWSSGSSWSARSPSSSLSSVKTETSNGGGITTYMHAGDHQPVKDEEEKKGDEQNLLVNGRSDNTGSSSSSSGKMRRSPAVLMEGSRCSRVNGRGWRCGQQTLVGYSLCEHHLGKGRLRSVSSVRCKKAGGAAAAGKQLPGQPVSAVQQLHHNKQQPGFAADQAIDDEDEEETKPAVGARRGKRIGIVKARSISSLLGQTCCSVVDHFGAIQEAAAPKMVPTATSSGLPAALVRSPVAGSTPSTATAASAATSLPPPTAAHQEGITAVM